MATTTSPPQNNLLFEANHEKAASEFEEIEEEYGFSAVRSLNIAIVVVLEFAVFVVFVVFAVFCEIRSNNKGDLKPPLAYGG